MIIIDNVKLYYAGSFCWFVLHCNQRIIVLIHLFFLNFRSAMNSRLVK